MVEISAVVKFLAHVFQKQVEFDRESCVSLNPKPPEMLCFDSQKLETNSRKKCFTKNQEQMIQTKSHPPSPSDIRSNGSLTAYVMGYKITQRFRNLFAIMLLDMPKDDDSCIVDFSTGREKDLMARLCGAARGWQCISFPRQPVPVCLLPPCGFLEVHREMTTENDGPVMCWHGQ